MRRTTAEYGRVRQSTAGYGRMSTNYENDRPDQLRPPRSVGPAVAPFHPMRAPRLQSAQRRHNLKYSRLALGLRRTSAARLTPRRNESLLRWPSCRRFQHGNTSRQAADLSRAMLGAIDAIRVAAASRQNRSRQAALGQYFTRWAWPTHDLNEFTGRRPHKIQKSCNNMWLSFI